MTACLQPHADAHHAVEHVVMAVHLRLDAMCDLQWQLLSVTEPQLVIFPLLEVS